MAWPSGSKAVTTNVDAGSDSPSSARADIKQNIDNVNSIIDTFDIASPNDGDILQYSSSNNRWEPIAQVGAGAGSLFYIDVDQSSIYPSGRTTINCSELFDPNNLITITSNQFTLDAGTYIVFGTGIQPYYSVAGTINYTPLILRNVTDSTDDLSIATLDDNNSGLQKLIVASTKTYEFQINLTASNVSVNMALQFSKF
jgi:hypothetical protein